MKKDENKMLKEGRKKTRKDEKGEKQIERRKWSWKGTKRET